MRNPNPQAYYVIDHRHHQTVMVLLNALDQAECLFQEIEKRELFNFYKNYVGPHCFSVPFHQLIVAMLKARLITKTNGQDLSVIYFHYENVSRKLGEIRKGEVRMSRALAERQAMLMDVMGMNNVSFRMGPIPPPPPGSAPKRVRSKNNRGAVQNGQQNGHQKQNGNRPNQTQQNGHRGGGGGGAPRKAKALETFVDQRFGFSLGKTFEPEVFVDTKNYCKECAKAFHTPEELVEHGKEPEHKFRVIYLKASSSHPISSKLPPKELGGAGHGLVIESVDGEEGAAILDVKVLLTVGEQLKKSRHSKKLGLKIHYLASDSDESYFLTHAFLVVGSKDLTFLDKDLPLEIENGEEVERWMTCYYDNVGTKEFVLVFKFSKVDDSEFFVMKRVNFRVDDESTSEDGRAVRHKPRLHTIRHKENGTEDVQQWAEMDFNIEEPELTETVIPPPRPKQSLKYTVTLGQYPLPRQYINYFNYGFKSGPKASIAVLRSKITILEYLSEGLNEANYCRYMALLLFLEEHQYLCDLRSYKMEDAQLERVNHGRTFRLKVPGLAENRPSVLKHDGIYITVDNDVYKGFIQHVEETALRIGMGSRFRQAYVDKMKVTVHFSFNRSCLRNMHRALELAGTNGCLKNLCYPKTYGTFTEDIKILSWFNRMVGTNPQQCQAVQNILCGTSKPSPYLIFGPPGTGKTVTIVESIKQIFKIKPNSRILATAPSNAAADLLAERILESVPKSKFIRLYGPSRDYRTVPEKLRPVSNFYEEECIFPAKNKLMEYRVVVTTVIVSGRMVSAGFPTGHFDFIYVDECGHGHEASALVPLSGLVQIGDPNPTQVVLAGDPKQLGPVVRSPVAKQLGLADSLLHRLMDSIDLFQKRDGEYNRRCVTKLLRNFRSHPHILKVPSDIFYANELMPCGDMTITSSACNWEWLPNPSFPLIFHGIEGKDEREPSSPSFFNIAEVAEVVNYVEKISQSKFSGQKLRPSDVGIIAPYRGQVNKIHRALERRGLTGYSVGSVEEFQGQERRVIIISTVRSNPAQLSLDHKFRLGFVREPRRFNVAVTRAKALLIIIGNPYILQTDHNWRQMLEHIINGGGYTGVPFTLVPSDDIVGEDPNELRIPVQEKLLEQLKLTKQAIEYFENNGDLPSGEVEHTQQMQRLTKQLEDMNILKVEVSEIEKMVSPPFQEAE